MSQSTIAVIGAGQWGTTLAGLLAGNRLAVRIWAREPEVVAAINAVHENTPFLPGLSLPPSLRATTCVEEAVDAAALLVIAIPSRWMRPSCRELATHFTASLPPLISVTKGLEIETGKRMSEIISEEIPGLPAIGVLSGPNLAPEVAQGQPAATVIASADEALARTAQEYFSTPHFRPYTGADVIGVEVCGAMKNVIAIAAGICEGLGYGDNPKAALLTRAMAEIGRLVHCLGGKPETVTGLAGIGDLIATCSSPISRNHRVGLAVGRGQDYRTALGNSGQVAEGVPTTEAVVGLARRLGVELPICEQVYAMLFEGCSPEVAVRALMTRERRSEQPVW
ncbi:MAG: NAD(P)H-dependent glycerol-3-phosphate dehydrogenase [Armatimonadota bacterium]